MSYLNTDVPELTGYDTGTVLGNLALLEGRLERILELSLTELSELSEAILRDAEGDPDTVVSILLSLRGQPMEEGGWPLRSRELLSASIPPLTGMTRHLGLYERLILYRLLSEKLPENTFFEIGSEGEHPSTADRRLAYMASALADKAYIRFADQLPHCRAATFHSFTDACEAVWDGRCEYCLLPVESTSEGLLAGFARLIVKYRLRIVAVCDIKGTGEESTRFALLKTAREDRIMGSPFATEATPATYLEVLHTAETPAYSELVAAAEFCGLTPERVSTLPRDAIHALGTEGEHSRGREGAVPLINTLWRIPKAELSAFLCYLSLEASEDTVLGLYPSI